MSKTAYADHGSIVFSYSTCIKQTLSGGLVLGNVTQYSPTTSRHQVQAGVAHCDVLLDNVPRGTDDLLSLAIERGLVMAGKWRWTGELHHSHLIPGEYILV